MKKLWLRDIACLIRHHLVCSSKSLVKVFFLIVFMTKKRQHCTRDKTIDARSLTSYIEGYGCWLSLIQTGSLSMWSVILCRLYTVARPAADMHTFTISDGWSWVQPSPAARCTSLVPPLDTPQIRGTFEVGACRGLWMSGVNSYETHWFDVPHHPNNIC